MKTWKYDRRKLRPIKDSYVRKTDLKRLEAYGKDAAQPDKHGYYVFYKTVAHGRRPSCRHFCDIRYTDGATVVPESIGKARVDVNRDPTFGCAAGLHVMVGQPSIWDMNGDSVIAVLVHQNDIACVPKSSAGNRWRGSWKVRVRRLLVVGLIPNRSLRS